MSATSVTSATAVRQPPPATATLVAVVRDGIHFQRRAPLTWGVSLGAMCALIAAIWPSVSDALQQAIESYPSGLKQAFGIVELNTVEKYIDAEMLSLVLPLAIGFFAIRSATRMLVGAEESGHLDALLSLPLSRRVLVVGSIIVTSLLLAAILIVCWILTLVAGLLANSDISASVIGAGFANVWPISFLFAGFAVFLSGILHRPSTVTGIAAGTLVAMYVIDLVGKISPDLKPFRFLSAFRWYGSAVQTGFDWNHALGICAVGLLLALIGMELFERRDVL